MRPLLNVLLLFRYEWGYGTDVDETMAEHFYRKAIAQAEQDQSAVGAEKAEPASLYFTGALLKLHTRQRLREGWATMAGLRGRLEEFWSETVAPALAQQGLEASTDDLDFKAAAVLAVVLAITILWRACCAPSVEEPRQQHNPTRSGPQETTRAAEQTVATEADATGAPHPSNPSPSLPPGMSPSVPPLPQEAGVERDHGQTVEARDRDARLEAALRRQQEQLQERRQEEEG